MADEPLSKPLEIIAAEGKVIVEGPGVAATLDVGAATLLAEQLHAASKVARTVPVSSIVLSESSPSVWSGPARVTHISENTDA